MVRYSKPRMAIAVVATVLYAETLLAQGPHPSFLTDPVTDLGFAACHIYFDGGSRRKIPFLPVVNAKGAPCGTNRYSTNIRLNAPIVFVGDGIVDDPVTNPYRGLDVAGKIAMISYDFPSKVRPDSTKVSMEERVREAIERKVAGVLLVSVLEDAPFPRYREQTVEKIPEIPIIAINKRNAAVILASDGRDPDETFRVWADEGRFLPGELAVKLDLRINSKFLQLETDKFTFAFQPGISGAKANDLSKVNERAVSFILKLFKETDPRWTKSFTAYFCGYDAKVFYVHHWGRGLSNDAGNFMWFDGTVPDFALATHENAHTLINQNWGWSSSFLVEGIGKYAEASATNKGSNHRITQMNLKEGKLFPLDEMAKMSIGSDPRTEVAYPAAGSFVQFLIEKYSLTKLTEIYQSIGKTNGDAESQASWEAVYGKSLKSLESEWLVHLKNFK